MLKSALIQKNAELEAQVAALKAETERLRERLEWSTEMGCLAISNQQAWIAAYYRDVPGAVRSV